MAYITKKTTQNGVKPIGSNLFGLCSTASSSSQKSVTMPDFNVLVSGVTIHVYFVYSNTAQNPTLAVGSTQGVPILRNGTNSGKWSSGSVISFTYDGTNWIQNDADDGSESITYGLSLNGNQLSLVEGGQSSSVTLTDDDTTYSLSISGNVLTLTDSDGNHDDVTLPSNSDTTYTISISGHTLTLTPSSGSPQTITLPDNDTKYGLSLNGDQLSLVEGGTVSSITLTDENTTYTLSISGNVLSLTGSDGNHNDITLPNNTVTYTLSKDGSTIKLIGSDGSETSVTDDNTWRVNTKADNGYVSPGGSNANYAWMTDANGNPYWRDPYPKTSIQTSSTVTWYVMTLRNGVKILVANFDFSSYAGTQWGNLYYADITGIGTQGVVSDARNVEWFGTGSGGQWGVHSVWAVSATSITARIVKPISSAQTRSFRLFGIAWDG